MTKFDELEIEAWNVADHLKTHESQIAYLQSAFDDNPEDSKFIAKVICDIARVRSTKDIATSNRPVHEYLYKALADDCDPPLSTILKAIHVMGFKIQIRALTTKQ